MQYSLWYVVPSYVAGGLSGDHQITHRQRIWVQHTISCITQSNAPEYGQNCCPKHVKLIGFINKPLLLHLLGFLLYHRY